MRRALALLPVALLLPGCGSTLPRPFDCDQPPLDGRAFRTVEEPVPGRYIVVLAGAAEALAREAVEATTTALVTEYECRNVSRFETALPGFAADMSRPEARRMARDPRVAFVQEDGTKRVSPRPAQQTDPVWGLDRIDQRDLPLDDLYEPGADGSGVHAYVLDTGVDLDHPEFAGRLGEAFSSFPGSAEDDHGHGTHVAGTLGGSEFGVAKAVVLHPVKVLVQGSGADSDVIEGVEWVTGHVQANGWSAVANMSLGGGASDAFDLAVCNSMAAGIAYAVAGGNDAGNACAGSPSRILQAVTVGATDSSDRVAAFSNQGECTDLFAPGVNIRSARWPGGSTVLSGTSMASPHAAGVAALCLERGAPPEPTAVAACLVDAATPERLSGVDSDTPDLLLYARED